MKIILCEHYQELPSYYPGIAIHSTFSVNMGNFKNRDNEFLKDFPIWEVFLALHEIECSHIAYVSLPISVKNENWDITSHIQVELWTKDKKNIFQPSLNAQSFCDNYTQHDFFTKGKIDENWVDFFQMQISQAKKDVQAQVRMCQEEQKNLQRQIASMRTKLQSQITQERALKISLKTY